MIKEIIKMNLITNQVENRKKSGPKQQFHHMVFLKELTKEAIINLDQENMGESTKMQNKE